INDKGGIYFKEAGHRLSLDIADDQSRPSIAASTTERLISENHDTLLLGPSNDATASRAAPVAEQHQVPMVSSGASSDAIFNSHYHYLFSVLAPRSRQLQGVVDMALAQDPKPQSVAILFASDSLSAEVANATGSVTSSTASITHWRSPRSSGTCPTRMPPPRPPPASRSRSRSSGQPRWSPQRFGRRSPPPT